MHAVKLFAISSHTAFCFSGLFARPVLWLQIRYRMHKLLAIFRASNTRMLVAIDKALMCVRVYVRVNVKGVSVHVRMDMVRSRASPCSWCKLVVGA